jgi:hypothetical protein
MSEDPFLTRPLAEVLLEAKHLLSDMMSWTQYAQARDTRGRSVRPNHPDACQWDIEGAVARFSNDMGILPLAAMYALDRVSVQLFGHVCPWKEESAMWAYGKHREDLIDMFEDQALERVVEVNDYLGYREVHQVLDGAILLALKERL